MEVNVTVRGPLFDKRLSDLVKAAIIEEGLEKIGDRMERGGRGLGAQRNVITRQRDQLVMRVYSSRKFPRTKGTAWQRKNMAIARAMAPRVLRSVANRIVGEL